ncbi:hypothetical protein D5281_06205 [bacterium 1xD42-62]|uniref:Uncharacterized protein n=1 Tax=Parablautia muri TaxID=2320879 RepID=A0A9X5BDT0_9FIRM|nr:hypothetical protein [Parablautia muri]
MYRQRKNPDSQKRGPLKRADGMYFTDITSLFRLCENDCLAALFYQEQRERFYKKDNKNQ